jgi:predicted transcriptional regulator
MGVEINYEMTPKRGALSFEECKELIMSPVQKEVFLIVDMWWEKYGFSPCVRDIAYLRGKSISATHNAVKRLVRLGVLKKLENGGRSIRPVYINFRNLE